MCVLGVTLILALASFMTTYSTPTTSDGTDAQEFIAERFVCIVSSDPLPHQQQYYIFKILNLTC